MNQQNRTRFAIEQLQKRPAAFQRPTGVTPDEFDTIVKAFEPIWNESEIARLNARKRKRAIGAVPTYKLEVTAQVLMTLIYLRQYCWPHSSSGDARGSVSLGD